jgi:hypothetical protein
VSAVRSTCTSLVGLGAPVGRPGACRSVELAVVSKYFG